VHPMAPDFESHLPQRAGFRVPGLSGGCKREKGKTNKTEQETVQSKLIAANNERNKCDCKDIL